MVTDLQASFEQAKNLFELQQYAPSEQLFMTLLEAKYDILTCHYYLGLIQLNTNQYKQALIHFTVCAMSDTHNYNYPYYLGYIAEQQHDADHALQYYAQALQLKPDHANALAGIVRLTKQAPSPLFPAGAHLPTSGEQSREVNLPASPPQAAPAIATPKAAVPNQEAATSQVPTQLYDELVEATDRDSLIALEMLRATSIVHRKPRLSAYAARLLLATFLLPFLLLATYVAIGMVFHWFSTDNIHFHHILSSLQVLYWYLALLIFIYTVLQIKAKTVTIDRGFIELTTGLFSRTKTIFLNHKADHFATHQNLFNLLTGDCTLYFDLDSGHSGKVSITGLGKIDEVNTLARNLQTLRYQLRNTPVIKSGIFG